MMQYDNYMYNCVTTKRVLSSCYLLMTITQRTYLTMYYLVVKGSRFVASHVYLLLHVNFRVFNVAFLIFKTRSMLREGKVRRLFFKRNVNNFMRDYILLGHANRSICLLLCVVFNHNLCKHHENQNV